MNETVDEWKEFIEIEGDNHTFDGIDYPEKNRYHDILPYSFNSVKLEKYINASWIDVGDNKVIVCQSPLPNTFYDFWKMVVTYNIDKIFMLTNIKENGVIKAHRYWPNSSLPQTIDDITIENLGSYDISNNIVRTEILVEHKDKRLCVSHLHYKGWSDYKIPSSIDDINHLINLYQKNENCIIHCSAGCGRSGTFCGIIRYLNTGESSIDIFKNMRKQRMYMINTIYQYHFMKNFILTLNFNT